MYSDSRMVNRGYARDDIAIVDYQLWKLPGIELEARGPAPTSGRKHFAVIGAAQTFGRFARRSYGDIIAERSGIECLNLGFSGAGPSFFTMRPRLIELINSSEFAIVLLMSGRSVSNTAFEIGQNQGVVTIRGSGNPPKRVYAEDAYWEFLQTEPEDRCKHIREETRANYVAENRELLRQIKVPKMLVFWSSREANYHEGVRDLPAFWGGFPHFVNQQVIDQLKPLSDAYVSCITARGMPAPLSDRLTGLPAIVYPEDRFPNVKLRDHNNYYPSPEMHEDVAEAILSSSEFPSIASGRSKPSSDARVSAQRVEIFVGVLGLPRSGTTMFSAVLDAHPDICTVYEPWNANKAAIRSGKLDITFEYLTSEMEKTKPGATTLVVKETAADQAYPTLLGNMLASVGPRQSRRMIVLLRDPLHCFLSEIEGRRRWWGEASLMMSSKLFTNWATRTTRSLRQLFELTRRFDGMFVFYDACVARPVETFGSVMQDIGLNFAAEQLNITRSSDLTRIRGDMSLSENARDVEDSSIEKRNLELVTYHELLQDSELYRPMQAISAFFRTWTAVGTISLHHPDRTRFVDEFLRLLADTEKFLSETSR
ncbi:MAG: DUF6473 family protein [Alphaproteobacteria bacterium]|nr:DUF6473 family protein [Alphaproteobacteria bacterium]